MTFSWCSYISELHFLSTSVLIWLTGSAEAQSLSLDLGGNQSGGESTARIIQIIALVTVLSLAPSILIMMTSFVRIMVVLIIPTNRTWHTTNTSKSSSDQSSVISNFVCNDANF